MAQRDAKYALVVNALVLLAFGWAAILIEIAPLGGRAGATPSPDLLFCVAAVLVLRRPAATPASLVLLLGLARDLVSGGAVGLGALTLLAAVEVLRWTRERLQRRSFIYEFAAVGALAIAMSLVQVVILTFAFTPSPALETLGLGVLVTVAAYIGIALVFRFVLRLRGDPLEARGGLRGAR